jgi:histidyl-tRNA synthetase
MVNNRKVLDGVMEALGLGGEANAGRRLAVLRAIDKLDRLGTEGVRLLLGPGRKDESGDFTTGAGLDERSIDLIVSVFGFGAVLTSPASAQEAQERPRDVISFDGRGGPWHRKATFQSVFETLTLVRGRLGSETSRFDEGIRELREIASSVAAAGYEDGRIEIDPSVVRGLEYYTGPVFEAELTFTVSDDEGRPVRFGSVGGGGRYDGLVGRFRSEPVPATGFSIGVSRLYAALQAIKSPIVAAPQNAGPVVVLVLDRDRIADYQRLVAELRGASVRAELYLGASGLKAQMKYADRRGAPVAVIQGSDERARGEVQIKDLVEGAEAAKAIATNREWKAARPAQETVPEDGMVAKVREVLARHR